MKLQQIDYRRVLQRPIDLTAADLKKIPLRSEQFILPSELHELLGLERSPGCPTGSRMALFLVPA